MGGREKRLAAKAEDGLAHAETALNAAADKTKQGATAIANKAKELGSEAKAQIAKVTK